MPLTSSSPSSDQLVANQGEVEVKIPILDLRLSFFNDLLTFPIWVLRLLLKSFCFNRLRSRCLQMERQITIAPGKNLPCHILFVFDNFHATRYPYCIVWCPIPCLTWLFPFIGHMGICMSSGKASKILSMQSLWRLSFSSSLDWSSFHFCRCGQRLCGSLLCVGGQHGFWKTRKILET